MLSSHIPSAPVITASTNVLFLGNSFTYGSCASDVQHFRTNTVNDLNYINGLDNGLVGPVGGVPALFKAFTVEAGLSYNVSLETFPGIGLDWHYSNRLSVISDSWDKIIMHGQSTLDFDNPGDPALITQYTKLLSNVFTLINPAVDISLTATWARADMTYENVSSPWYGKSISAMAYDIQDGYDYAATQNTPHVKRVNPVGLAWNRAMDDLIADPNPYDGLSANQINLWCSSDNYHASHFGYYLHALVVFGKVTGIDPRTLGDGDEAVASELGLAADVAKSLRIVAWEQIQAEMKGMIA